VVQFHGGGPFSTSQWDNTQVLINKTKGKTVSKSKTNRTRTSNSVQTKAYTLSMFLKQVARIPQASARTTQDVVRALSPRKGQNSVKIVVLNRFLNGKLFSILNGSNASGASPKARLLNALKVRKNTGSY
jgi:hypothetical protein